MSVEKSFTITLKVAVSDSGVFESIRVLKARSQIPENILDSINTALQSSLIPAVPTRTTIEIGNDAEIKVMNHLRDISKMNSGFVVFDTSSQTGHGDICVEYKDKRVCVEIKSYKNPVPMPQIDKYHTSLALAEYDVGILFQNDPCGYAREAGIRSPVDLRIVNGKLSVYLTACDLELLYPVILFLVSTLNLSAPIDANELELKRKALLAIREKLADLRACIAVQKKSIAKMEALVESIATLAL